MEAETDRDSVVRVPAVAPEDPGAGQVRVGVAERTPAGVCGTREKPQAAAEEARDSAWAVEVEPARARVDPAAVRVQVEVRALVGAELAGLAADRERAVEVEPEAAQVAAVVALVGRAVEEQVAAHKSLESG